MIAYYPLKIYNNYNYINKDYLFYIFNNKGRYKNLIGDLPKKIPLPINNISFLAYLVNEPGINEIENSKIEIIVYNDLKEGDIIYEGYKLIAKKNIMKGTEITWCYGPSYKRNYKTSCKK